MNLQNLIDIGFTYTESKNIAFLKHDFYKHLSKGCLFLTSTKDSEYELLLIGNHEDDIRVSKGISLEEIIILDKILNK